MTEPARIDMSHVAAAARDYQSDTCDRAAARGADIYLVWNARTGAWDDSDAPPVGEVCICCHVNGTTSLVKREVQ
jgi:hypothetical protein